MPEGGCFCGKTRYKYTGDVQAAATCHCRDCQKITGSAFSTNIIVPGDGFEVLGGNPKKHTVKADSGNQITSNFCPECGSTMWREGDTFGTAKVIKVGTLDDPKALNDAKPGVELYAPERVNWVKPVDGAGQKQGMPDSQAV
ncbi:hypothetical protein BAUCODRAFT_78587 [Baudoinia panamericana UAMH 10762]|uniref:CENP-V/GFA domain-containing protein n=1 Tax=Baudoinia panamericana (strain UAMH 10762) TaxID=717646 RepID=M2N0D0_BAUPA|nr:uncharacterized protein BAUCODRAFT_78587 [Baudoinia panamericana UAMH 10762]EMC92030.1 hypothetical protein BAUCODRAFT_78587 [Baudoinia panamericana UAMH 10762]